MTVILLVTGAVLVLTCSAYFAYEFFTFRHATVKQLSTLGEIIATNSTAVLAFDNPEDANEILSALKANPHIVAAALYDSKGNLFSHYPSTLPRNYFHSIEKDDGYYFEESHLIGLQAVVQGDKRLGTLYLKSDMEAMRERLVLYSGIAILVIALSFLLAYVLSKILQKQISKPILALASTAKGISERRDYSVRAVKLGDDEIGLLTDAFNHMLTQIQQQNHALSESSDRMFAVMNSAMSAVIVMNANGTVSEWNTHAEKIFGWTRQEAIDRELVEFIIPQRYRQMHRKGLQHFLSTGEGPAINKLIELSALHRDGTEFPVELIISPLRTGNVIAFCGFITDITKRKQAEEEIRAFNQRLEQKVEERTNELRAANHELEAFSYSVSHDLRAPLRSIHGYMNIFSEDYASNLDDEALRLMNIILSNAKKMGQLIDDLLAFSQLGRREIVKENISMKDIAASLWDDLIRIENPRNIEFVLSNLPPAYADSVTIKQVWTNLISNAIKYTRHSPKTMIEIGAHEKENETVYYVKDNGAGFDMRYYDKLFGVFQRLHKTSEFEGTGVGLAIVQRIISKHGGRIWAEAKPNEGATFYFSLAKKQHSSNGLG